MPVFFLISGMCFDSSKYSSFWNFLKKKFKTIIIPYFGFCLFGFAISYFKLNWRETLFQIDTIKQVFYYTQPELLHVGQYGFW